uniref:Putative serine carboxypeptidase n=1 Tax=Ixodes ricinus TaxID=34613 RepID=V5GNK4_IXORI
MKFLRLVTVVFALLATICVVKPDADGNGAPSRETASTGMFFSPYLNTSIHEAVNKSKVKIFKEIANVDAYSGYISLSTQSHLFFLLTKAPKKKRDSAPLLLWLYGGPGKSSMWAQFLENGPVGIERDRRSLQEKRNPSRACKRHLPRSTSRRRTQHNQKLY